jgi:hypothetical protein
MENKTVLCKECKNEISKGVRKCPFCNTKNKSRRGLKIFGGIIGALILLSIISSFRSDNKEPTKQVAVDTEQSEPAIDESNQVTEKSVVEEPKLEIKKEEVPQEPVYEIGAPIQSKKFEILVSKVFTSEKVGGEWFQEKASSGGEFVIVEYQYKNTSKKPIGRFSCPSVYLYNSTDEVSFNTDTGANIAYYADNEFDEKSFSKLNPNITIKTANVFEIASIDLQEKEWKIRIVAGNDYIYIPISF